MLRHMRALGVLLVLVAGCLDPRTRAQMAEESEKERDLDVRTVWDVSEIVEDGLMKVQGVGLVTGLAGTGHCPPGIYRDMLEQYLLKRSNSRNGEITAENVHIKVRHILNDPDNALVYVTGYIPAGARRGDRFDVEITLPRDSRCTSLAGGTLQLSVLRIHEAVANLTNDPLKKKSGTILPGHEFGHAKGQLMVGFGGHSDSHELRRARVWQGGVTLIDRPYVLRMKKDEASVAIANNVAQRINYMYQDAPNSRDLLTSGLNKGLLSDQQKQFLLVGNVTKQLNHAQDPDGLTQQDVAKASKECLINMRVPHAYRLDHERFLRVSRLTPLYDNDPNLPRYKLRLQKMLLDPRDAVRAAIRLEALGRDSIPLLKSGLASEHPFVRFAAAESLAYLGSTAGVETLAQLAQQHSLLVKPCTIALANCDESIARDKLAELMSSTDPALAGAAFHALALHDETEPRLGGKLLNDTYSLFRVPQAQTSMVYFTPSKQARVILLGRNITLAPTTPMLVGVAREFTIAPGEQDGQFRVKRITTAGEQQRICPNRLDVILFALADLGATYPDIIDFLRRAHDSHSVSCPVVAFAVPDVTLQTLNQEGPGLK